MKYEPDHVLALRAEGLSYRRIMDRTGMSYEEILMICDPEQGRRRQEYRREFCRRSRREKKRDTSQPLPYFSKAAASYEKMFVMDDGEVLIHRGDGTVIRTRRYSEFDKPLSARLLGDPNPGRSALDQMGGSYKPKYPSYNGY